MKTRNKRKSFRRTTLALVLCSAVALAGCGTSKASSTSNSSSQKITLTFWNGIDVPTDPSQSLNSFWITKAIKMFEQQNPNITVNDVKTPQPQTNQFNTMFRSAGVAQKGPDVTILFAGGQVVDNSQYLLPLDKYISPTFKNSINLGWNFVQQGFSPSGKIYGIPFGAGYWYFVYYNKTLFKKAGININDNNAPTTWAQFLSLCAQLKSKGITPLAVGEKEGYMGAWFQDALISGLVGQSGVIDMYNGKTSLNSPAIIKAYQAWHQLYQLGYTNQNAATLAQAQGSDVFLKGQAAMTVQAQWLDSQAIQAFGSKNVGMFPVPMLPGSKYPKTLSGGPNDAYVVTSYTKHPNAAVKFAEFLASPQVQEMSINASGLLPNTTNYSLKSVTDPLLIETNDWIKRGYHLSEAFDNIMPASVCTYWYRTNSAVFGGNMTPQDAAKGLEGQFQQYQSTSGS